MVKTVNQWQPVSKMNKYYSIKNINNIYMKKEYEKIILCILILFFLLLLIHNFIPLIEGVSITDKEKNMIYNQQSDVNTIKTKQQNLIAEMQSIKKEMTTSNKLMADEKTKVEDTLKKADKKAEATGIKKG